MSLRRSLVPLRNVAALGALASLVCILAYNNGADAALWRMLGINGVATSSLARTASITIPAHAPVFGPTAVAIAAGGRVTFVNQLDSTITIKSTAEAPERFTVVVGAHARATITLPQPGLYHYYDATRDQIAPPAVQIPASSATTGYSGYSGYADSYGATDQQSVPTATPATIPEAGMSMPAVSSDDVIVPKSGTGLAREGWIEVLSGMPDLQQYVMIPPGQAIFTPKVLVAVAGGTIMVMNHDAYAHNFVVDAMSPMGAAFMIEGTKDVPPHGAQRTLVLQQPGLYHVYCTLHTRVAGLLGGWHRVVPHLQGGSWGSDASDPMEAWIIVLSATMTV